MPYLTIDKEGSGVFKEKGSKFIGFAFHLEKESDIKPILESLKKNHSGCCHVCYAYKLGLKGENYRFSDDGEPNNSAGLPILGQINALGLTQVLVAVVRFYGGVNLGVGGLIQAYRRAAKSALENASTRIQEVMIVIQVDCTYEKLPTVMKEIKTKKIQIVHQNLDLKCSLKLNIPEPSFSHFKDFLEKAEIQFFIEQ
jgi:uncharacterized YigZ family protein